MHLHCKPIALFENEKAVEVPACTCTSKASCHNARLVDVCTGTCTLNLQVNPGKPTANEKDLGGI